MDLRKLKTLIELVEGSGIAELEISEGEERVRITRTVAAAHQITMPAPQTVVAAAQGICRCRPERKQRRHVVHHRSHEIIE